MALMDESELRSWIEKIAGEMRGHFDVVAEGLGAKVEAIAEGVVQATEEIRRTRTDLDQRITTSANETQAMIKFSHAELARRVATLEKGQRALEETVTDLRARIDRIESGTH